MVNTSRIHATDNGTDITRGDRLIDLVHLARQTLGDHGLEQEVLRIFAAASQSYAAGVRDAKCLGELKLNLHSLKGASAGIGAFGLANVARDAETELRETGDVGAETRADIGFAVEEANIYIASLLKN